MAPNSPVGSPDLPGPPKPESVRAWVVVGAAFVSMATVFAVAYSYGSFFDVIGHEYEIGKSATSWFFAITGFLWFTLGVVTGPAADRLGPRPVVLFGAVVMGAGLVVTALVHSLWVAYLAYGAGVGIGVACGYVPMVATVGGWFARRRSLAIGISVTGIGVGTVLGPAAAAALILRIGWRPSYLVIGGVAFALLAACAVATKRPPASGAPAAWQLGELVRTRLFVTLYVGNTILSFGLFMAFVHLVPYATRHGIQALPAAALLGVVGAGSALGRLALGGFADQLGALRTFKASVLLLALSFAIWLLVPGYAGLLAFAALMGIGYGGWVALSPPVVAELWGARGLGGSVGALYTGAGLGALIGPPLAGLLVDVTGSYTWAIAGGLATGLVSFAILRTVRPQRAPLTAG